MYQPRRMSPYITRIRKITLVTLLLGLIYFYYYYFLHLLPEYCIHQGHINAKIYQHIHQHRQFGDKTGEKKKRIWGKKKKQRKNVLLLTWFNFFQRLRTGESSLDQISLSNLQPAVTDLPKIFNCEITWMKKIKSNKWTQPFSRIQKQPYLAYKDCVCVYIYIYVHIIMTLHLKSYFFS